MNFQIKSRLDGSALFELECGSLKLCVEAAVKARANLAGANLAGAYLAAANLADAKWRDGIVIQRQPIQIYGLDGWSVTILDEHMQIGCELHTFAEWRGFNDKAILKMSGKEALVFWRRYGAVLLALCATREPIKAKEAA